MPSIVPSVPNDAANLADVLPSCLVAMGQGAVATAMLGREARIALRPARSAVVVLVDGLGANALAARAGHARFLAAGGRRMRSGFPTTTAAALTTLTTSASPGEHGVVGYSGFEPESGTVVNLLGGWDDQVPAGWLLRPTVFSAASEAGVAVRAVGPARYHSSGFTRSVLGGSTYVDADSVPARVDAALDAVSTSAPTLVYLYVPELDSIAHKQGWQSDRWTRALESLDAELQRLARTLPTDVGMLVTADHGILDVPEESNVAIDDDLLEGVVAVAGDPRCRQLTVAPGTDVDALVARWRERAGRRAWTASRAEAIDAGWFGAVDPRVVPRIGDVVVVSRGAWAHNDDRAVTGTPKRMIGQHGGMSDDESFVPLVLAGAFAR
ncbi:alkaline phosphatase family protein [Curtobacterium sp. RRHDQ10]|uniref:alkaline phosphatase family protein n=1 Tax=Curtobacterium phyllosphaerae TaxID=3413379 RepID=UPI003BF0642F